MQGYAAGSRAHGADIRTGCEVLEIETSGGEITSVLTSDGPIRTGAVICAAGAWSRACGEMVGVALPVTPLRRQILFTEAIDGLPAELPMTIDFASSFYFHREGPGLLMGMSDPHERPGFSVETSDDWLPELMAVVRRRAPRIAEVGIRGGWAGLYEMTPDHNGIIGEAAGASRFLYATGFSGHGFLQGPAVGEILRDMYLAGRRSSTSRPSASIASTPPRSDPSTTWSSDHTPVNTGDTGDLLTRCSRAGSGRSFHDQPITWLRSRRIGTGEHLGKHWVRILVARPAQDPRPKHNVAAAVRPGVHELACIPASHHYE